MIHQYLPYFVFPLTFLLLVSIPSAVERWQDRVSSKKPAPPKPDPVALEARRLAAEEVEELDWRMGTGPKPQHVIAQEKAEEKRKQVEAYERDKARWAAEQQLKREANEKWALDQADKAATDLALYYREHYGEEDVKTHSELVNELYKKITAPVKNSGAAGLIPILLGKGEEVKLLKPPKARHLTNEDMLKPDLPDYAVEGVDYVKDRHVARAMNGDVAYDITTVTPIGEFAGQEPLTLTRTAHYPRPRHPGTRSGGPG